MQQTVELETDGKPRRAVDIQRSLVEAAGRYLDERKDHTFRRDVWQAWAETVEDLAVDPGRQAGRLDWVTKHEFLQAQMEARGWKWSSPQVRELDFKYHRIDPEGGLFHMLQDQGMVDRLVSDEQVTLAGRQPPRRTRARLRTACLERYYSQVRVVNWDTIVFAAADGHTYRWHWNDPTYDGDEQLELRLAKAATFEQFLQSELRRQSEQRAF